MLIYRNLFRENIPGIFSLSVGVLFRNCCNYITSMCKEYDIIEKIRKIFLPKIFIFNAAAYYFGN